MQKPLLPGLGLPQVAPVTSASKVKRGLLASTPNASQPKPFFIFHEPASAPSHDPSQTLQFDALMGRYKTLRDSDPAHNGKPVIDALREFLAQTFSGKILGDPIAALTLWRDAIIASDDPFRTLDEMRHGTGQRDIRLAYSALEDTPATDPRQSAAQKYLAAWAEFKRLSEHAGYADFYKRFISRSDNPYCLAERAYHHSEDAEATIDWIDNALRRYPDHPKLTLSRAHFLFNSERWQEAGDTAGQLTIRYPDWYLPHLIRGLALSKLDEPVEAIASLECAQNLRPRDSKIEELVDTLRQEEIRNRVQSFWQAGGEAFDEHYYHAATRNFREGLTIEPDNHLARAYMALAMTAAGQRSDEIEPEARRAFESAYADDDANLATMDPIILHAFCIALIYSHKDAEAESYLDVALETRPDDRILRYSKAKILWSQAFHNPGSDLLTLHARSISILEELEATQSGEMQPTDVMIVETLIDHLQDDANRLHAAGNLQICRSRRARAEKLLRKHHALGETSHIIRLTQLEQLRRTYNKFTSGRDDRSAYLLALYNCILPTVERDLAGPDDFGKKADKLHAAFCRLSTELYDDDPVRDRLVDFSSNGDRLKYVIDSKRQELGKIPAPQAKAETVPVKLSTIVMKEPSTAPAPARPVRRPRRDGADTGLLNMLGNIGSLKPPGSNS